MSTIIDGRLFVKISELEEGSNFGLADEFVFVQNGTTLKISGQTVTDSIVELGNLASKSYVDAIVAGAPDLLNTLDEIAAALGDDENFASNIINMINNRVSTSDFETFFDATLAARNTYHLAEGSNLYWTQERFDSAFSAKNTYHLAEGSNLYFTEQRVLDVVGPLLADIVIPTDVNQLTDVDGLLGSGGGGGGGTTLPNQSGNAGKVLTTDGTNLSWTTVSAGSSPTFTTVNTTTLNVQTVAFTGTGAVTITSGNDLNFVAAGQVTINGETFISLEDLKLVVASSADFADFKSRIAGI
jgi:hypothetical protein